MYEYIPQLRPLVIWPDQKLRTVCTPVNYNDTKQLISDMCYTVRHHNGYGLAAPQVGELLRVIVVRIPSTTNTDNTTTEEQLQVMVNPELTTVDDTYTYPWKEGCLSVPGYFEERRRPQRIFIKYQDEYGIDHHREAQGLHAFIIQHEIDHLEGKVFVDDLSRLKQQRVKKKIDKTIRHTGRGT